MYRLRSVGWSCEGAGIVFHHFEERKKKDTVLVCILSNNHCSISLLVAAHKKKKKFVATRGAYYRQGRSYATFLTGINNVALQFPQCATPING